MHSPALPCSCVVLPLAPALAWAWLHGAVGDRTAIQRCELGPVPWPVVVLVLELHGRAGLRQLVRWLRCWRRQQAIAGLAVRTRSEVVAGWIDRFNGLVALDEGDGDRRFWLPMGPIWARMDGDRLARDALIVDSTRFDFAAG